LSSIEEMCRGYEDRRIVFQEIDGTEPTIIQIGIAKFGALSSRVRRMRAIGEEPDILELMTWSRKQLRGVAM